jgi:hypothetical protein
MAIDKDKTTIEDGTTDGALTFARGKDGTMDVGPLTLDLAHWTIGPNAPTRAQIGTLYQMAMGVLGGNDAHATDAVIAFLDGVKDADKVRTALSSVSKAAQKAKDAERVARFETILKDYNEGNAPSVKALAKRYNAAKTKWDGVNADVDKVRQELVKALELDADKLGVVVFLPKDGRFWIDSDALTDKGKTAFAKRRAVVRVWDVEYNVPSAKRYGVEFAASAKADKDGVDKDGNANWTCTLTVKGKTAKTATGKGSLASVFEHDLYIPIMRQNGVDKDGNALKDQPDKPITLNVPAFFGVARKTDGNGAA